MVAAFKWLAWLELVLFELNLNELALQNTALSLFSIFASQSSWLDLRCKLFADDSARQLCSSLQFPSVSASCRHCNLTQVASSLIPKLIPGKFQTKSGGLPVVQNSCRHCHLNQTGLDEIDCNQGKLPFCVIRLSD